MICLGGKSFIVSSAGGATSPAGVVFKNEDAPPAVSACTRFGSWRIHVD